MARPVPTQRPPRGRAPAPRAASPHTLRRRYPPAAPPGANGPPRPRWEGPAARYSADRHLRKRCCYYLQSGQTWSNVRTSGGLPAGAHARPGRRRAYAALPPFPPLSLPSEPFAATASAALAAAASRRFARAVSRAVAALRCAARALLERSRLRNTGRS
jgi:hypothetical protein